MAYFHTEWLGGADFCYYVYSTPRVMLESQQCVHQGWRPGPVMSRQSREKKVRCITGIKPDDIPVEAWWRPLVNTHATQAGTMAYLSDWSWLLFQLNPSSWLLKRTAWQLVPPSGLIVIITTTCDILFWYQHLASFLIIWSNRASIYRSEFKPGVLKAVVPLSCHRTSNCV